MLPIFRKGRMVLCSTSYWLKVNDFFLGAAMPLCGDLSLPGVMLMSLVMAEEIKIEENKKNIHLETPSPSRGGGEFPSFRMETN
jgi:hypothetical protein